MNQSNTSTLILMIIILILCYNCAPSNQSADKKFLESNADIYNEVVECVEQSNKQYLEMVVKDIRHKNGDFEMLVRQYDNLDDVYFENGNISDTTEYVTKKIEAGKKVCDYFERAFQ